MAGEIFKRLRDGGERNFGDVEFAAFSAVMKMIGREYTSLVITRNNLLHAQWGMEFPFEDDPDGLKLFIFKGESNKDGWAPLENLPQTASELLNLSKKCQEISHWVFLIARCFDGGDSEKKITDCFKLDGKQWYCALPVDEI